MLEAKVVGRGGGCPQPSALLSNADSGKFRQFGAESHIPNCESSVNALVSVGSSFHQEGAKAEKALFTVEVRHIIVNIVRLPYCNSMQ